MGDHQLENARTALSGILEMNRMAIILPPNILKKDCGRSIARKIRDLEQGSIDYYRCAHTVILSEN
jgi:hypothetical protein